MKENNIPWEKDFSLCNFYNAMNPTPDVFWFCVALEDFDGIDLFWTAQLTLPHPLSHRWFLLFGFLTKDLPNQYITL